MALPKELKLKAPLLSEADWSYAKELVALLIIVAGAFPVVKDITGYEVRVREGYEVPALKGVNFRSEGDGVGHFTFWDGTSKDSKGAPLEVDSAEIGQQLYGSHGWCQTFAMINAGKKGIKRKRGENPLWESRGYEKTTHLKSKERWDALYAMDFPVFCANNIAALH